MQRTLVRNPGCNSDDIFWDWNLALPLTRYVPVCRLWWFSIIFSCLRFYLQNGNTSIIIWESCGEDYKQNNKHWILQLVAIIISLLLCPGKGMLGLICSSLSSCRANSHSNFLLSPKLGVHSPVFKKEIHFYALILSFCLSFCVCVYLSACV